MTANTIWFASTNSNVCRIYEFNQKEKTLTFIKELNHPESKLKIGELVADKPGHYKTSSATRGTYSPREDAKEVEIDNFAREVAKELTSAKNTNLFQQLILAAAPRMNGKLFKHLDNDLKECILLDINKDFANLKNHEMLDVLLKEFKNAKTLKP